MIDGFKKLMINTDIELSLGRAAVWVIAGVKLPEVVTVNVCATPALKVTLENEVITVGTLTFSVKLLVAFGVIPLKAVTVIV